eukprot:TRINITY_DN851_c1_g1_i3.p1 TRINITY_DN851_c1_g1~~TRINITY_DN851_c1_g1_i3.p1  ORF type:complete len:1283 (+),score=258.87 TRINITY_DN851_c1_g1_i3:77-3925(+)
MNRVAVFMVAIMATLPLTQAASPGNCPNVQFSSSGADTLTCDYLNKCPNCNMNCNANQKCTTKCTADRACERATLNCPDGKDCVVKCEWDNACTDMTVNCPTTGKCLITCANQWACKGMKIRQRGGGGQLDLKCNGQNSCTNANVVCPTSGAKCNIPCPEQNSCNTMTVTAAGTSPLDMDCKNYRSCYRSTITCPASADCNVQCESTGNACVEAKIFTEKPSNAPQTGTVTVTCKNHYDCRYLKLDCGYAESCKITCTGNYACEEVRTKCTNSGTCVQKCTVRNSCSRAEVSHSSGAATGGETRFLCQEESACESTRLTCKTNRECNRECKGYRSCFDSTFDCSQSGVERCSQDCRGGEWVCQTTMKCPSEPYKCESTCVGDNACKGSLTGHAYPTYCQQTGSKPPCDNGYQNAADKTTEAPTPSPGTDAPPTAVPTTPQPASTAPATAAPATSVPATAAPATNAPATVAPPTSAPATLAPDTLAPTSVPATPAPGTQAPATVAPGTSAPATPAPATPAPATNVPGTSTAPATPAPATSVPATAPVTDAPATQAPVTAVPDTAAPDTAAPDTSAPDTMAPDTMAPKTMAPATAAPTANPSATPTTAPTATPTAAPPTATPTVPPTAAPTAIPTSAPDTLAPLANPTFVPVTPPPTDAPDTNPPMTFQPAVGGTATPTTFVPPTSTPTSAPATAGPDTARPSTLVPGTTLAPATGAPNTSVPVTGAPDTDAPDTDAPAPEANLTVAVTPGPPSGKALTGSAKDKVNGATSVSSGTALLSGAGAGAIARVAVLKDLGCEVEDVDIDEDETLDWEFHPTGLGVGNSPRKYLFGAVVMNPVLILGILTLLVGLAACLKFCKGLPTWGAALGAVKAPGLIFIPFLFLVQGTSLISARVAFFPGNGLGTFEVGLAWVVLIICITSPGVLYAGVLRRVHTEACMIPDARLHPDDPLVKRLCATSGAPKVNAYTGVTAVLYKLAFGDRIWVSSDAGSFFADMYGGAFDSFKPGAVVWFPCLEIMVMVILSMLAAWRPTKGMACDTRNIFICCLFAGFFFTIVIKRPYLSVFDNFVAVLLSFCMFLSVLLMTTGLWMHLDSESFPFLSSAYILLSTAYVVFFKAVWDMVFYFIDIYIGRRQSARTLARESANSSNHSIPEMSSHIQIYVALPKAPSTNRLSDQIEILDPISDTASLQSSSSFSSSLNTRPPPLRNVPVTPLSFSSARSGGSNPRSTPVSVGRNAGSTFSLRGSGGHYPVTNMHTGVRGQAGRRSLGSSDAGLNGKRSLFRI